MLCRGTAAGGGCPSTALHRHDQLAKYHPVPWLRWPNVSWHQVFRLPETIVNLSNMYPSWNDREFIVNLSWIYREPIPDANSFFQFEEFNVWKSWNFAWNGSIWLGMSSTEPYGSRSFSNPSWPQKGLYKSKHDPKRCEGRAKRGPEILVMISVNMKLEQWCQIANKVGD